MIVIEGLAMPKGEDDGILIALYDGKAHQIGTKETFTASEVSAHGDLIDAGKLVELCDIMANKCDGIGVSIWHQFKTTVEWSPIVIKADEGDTGDK